MPPDSFRGNVCPQTAVSTATQQQLVRLGVAPACSYPVERGGEAGGRGGGVLDTGVRHVSHSHTRWARLPPLGSHPSEEVEDAARC